MGAAPTITLPSDTEILVQREFAAPPELVWRAWTEPDLVRRWWAGRRGTMRECEIDFRVGGRYRFVMDASNGMEVAFSGEYLEIEPHDRYSQTEVFEAMPPGEEGPVRNVMSFVPTDAGTRLEILIIAPNQDVRDAMAQSGMEVGIAEQVEIIDDLLSTLA